MLQHLAFIIQNEEAQGMTEYVLVIGLIAILLMLSLTDFAGGVVTLFAQITGAMG